MRFLFLFFTLSISLSESFAIDPKEPSYVQGLNAFNNSYFLQAIPLLEKATAINPNNYDALYRLGIAYMKVQNFKKAIPTLLLLIPRFEKKVPQVYFEVAKIYYAAKANKKAEEYFLESEKRGFQVHAAQYYRAYMKFLDKSDPAETVRLFKNIEDKSSDQELKQGAAHYLGLLYFDQEKPDFKDNKFVRALTQLEKSVALNSSSDAGRASAGKMAEINSLLGRRTKSDRWSLSLSQTFEFDSNVLNENQNTVRKTGASAMKSTTLGDITYRAIEDDYYYWHPNLSMNFAYNFPLPYTDANRDAVAGTHALVTTTGFNTGHSLLIEETPIDFSYPVSISHTVNQSATAGQWRWYAINPGITPTVRWQTFGSNFTSLGMNYNYSINADDTLNVHTLKTLATQTWTIGTYNTSYNWTGSYAFGSNDKISSQLGATISKMFFWETTTTAGLTHTLTHNIVETTRGLEQLFNLSLGFNRVFSDWLAVNLTYYLDLQASDSATAEYIKHRLALRTTLSF